MTPEAARQECRDLVIRLTHASDHGRAEEAAALFAAEGSWQRGGELLRGAEAIRASVAARACKTVRHLVTATMIELDGPDRATGVSYYLSFSGQGQPPLPLDPASMGEWHDRFVRTDAGWRFAHREVRRIFARQH